ncbi:MAG: biotin/lipoyl-binding protein, partial [Gammaproteobacteria bacterium]|nr:biotin/lipoyl-binding protein [Gammaproteobacteria bacterium]
MSTTLIRRLVLALLCLLLLALGLWWINRPKPVSVALWQIDQGRVEASVANTRAGTVEACQRTKLSATMGGRIEVLAVKEGDKVKKGQLLMKLWNDDQQPQITLA